MNKFLFFLFISLSLPIISPAQNTNITAKEANKKGNEYYNNKDYTEAVKWYRIAAEQGYAQSQRNLGVMYKKGYGVTKDYTEAVKWFRKAAEQGHAEGQCNLAIMYYNGDGVTKDYTEAEKWYRKAAEQGDAQGQCNLGVMYSNGYGVTKDYTEAVKWFRKAAEQGHTKAMYYFGNLYENGQGVPQNYQTAKEWYQKALNKDPNFTLAKDKLAKITAEEANKKGDEYYDKKNYTEAIKWYRIAAEHGYAIAQCNLGVIYGKGYGVTKDYKEAAKWFRKAADQGDVLAQYNLGVMYYDGKGVTKDYAEALKWYRKVADKGYASAQNNLGYMYHMGYGVEKDYKLAKEWYEKAIAQDEDHAMEGMGELYEYGHGVPQNYQTAKEWYMKALNKNPDNNEAKEGLARVEKIIADQSSSNKSYAQNSTITQPKAKPQPKEETKPKVEPKAKVEPQPKVETFLVDTDIPVISRVNKNTFAIIIANEDYMDEAKVDFAKNDGEVFKNYCNKTLGLPETNIHYLPNATLAKMFGELDWLRQVCEVYKGEANVIFYYSGHGFPDEKSHAAYIIPVDGNKRLLRTCFSVSELYEMLGSMPSKRVTVLMDACFSGAKRSGDMLASAKGVAIKVKYGAPKGNMVVMAAAQGDETAYFNKEAKHGLFTYFLLKKLKETKGSVTLGDLSSYIQDEVSKYSIVVNGKSQTPSVQASDKLAGSWRSLNF